MFLNPLFSFSSFLTRISIVGLALWGCNGPAFSKNSEPKNAELSFTPKLATASFLRLAQQKKEARLSKNYPWMRVEKDFEPLQHRFKAPAGFKRVSLSETAFSDEKTRKMLHFSRWLRNLPLRKVETPVLSFTNSLIEANAAAVIDLDVGDKDLQQCADSILRLRAEYLLMMHREDEIKFHFTSGHLSSWKKWRQGFRPKILGAKVHFLQTASPDSSRFSFRNYLENLFMYAGTASLKRYGKAVKINELRAGDYFVEAGFPGHAVLLLDVAINKKGERRFLVGQGYMPAQSFHVVKDKNGSPWLSLHEKDGLHILSWPKAFSATSIRRF